MSPAAVPAGAAAGSSTPVPLAWVRGEEHPQLFQGPLLHQQFDSVAAARPTAICLVDDASGTELTYGQVAEAAGALARTLARLGVGRDMAVGILVERSPAVVIAMLAVLKTGGFYVPLDPSYQAERLAGYVQDSAATVIVSQHKLAGQAHELADAAVAGGAGAHPAVLLIEDVAAGIGSEVEGSLAPVEDLSVGYCMFTSGSTGRPKGVEVTHGGLRDLIHFFVDKMDLGPNDVFCLNTTVCFDPYVLYLYGCLVTGGRLIIPRSDGHTDPTYMAELCRHHGVTILEVVPSLAVEYLRDLAPLGHELRIRRFLTGGEALSPSLATAAYKTLPGCEMVWNTYGPTEVTVQVITGAIPRGADRVPLGRPDHNVHCYISSYVEDDEQDKKTAKRMCGVGEPGELLLSGPRLGRGYRGRPDLTADKFIPNPFYDTTTDLPPHIRKHYRLVYRTGDLVRWGADGQLDFLGRIDHQVKVNGVRIELAEVETALACTPGVARAAAVAWKDARLGTYRLAGYVVAHAGAAGGAEAVAEAAKESCRSKLVPAMVPAIVMALPDMRLLPNGKTDLKSLPEPEWGAQAAQHGYVAPADDVEEQLSAIWASALPLPPGDQRISTADDFFELGGTSLLAGRINSEVRKRLGIDISGLVIFQSRTVASMAATIRSLQLKKRAAEAEPTGSSGSSDSGSDTLGKESTDGSDHVSTRLRSVAAVVGKPLPMWFCTFLQLLGYIVAHLVEFVMFLGPSVGIIAVYAYSPLQIWQVTMIVPLIMIVFYLVAILMCILLKWIVIGRQRPGTYSLWGWYYVRWWTVRAIFNQVANSVLPAMKGSELLNIVMRCMGAKIGRNVTLDSTTCIQDWDLVTIGDDTVVESNAFISGSATAAGTDPSSKGTITFGPVVIGAGCTLGSQCCVRPGTTIPDGGVVKTGTSTSHPESVSGKPLDGAEIRTAHAPLPLVLQVLAWLLMTVLYGFIWLAGAMPVAFLWRYLSGMQWQQLLPFAMKCWTSDHWTTQCKDLYTQELLAILIWPVCLFLSGQAFLLFVIFFKWTVMGRFTPEKCERTDVWWRFRSHMWKLVQESPLAGHSSDPWTGTVLYNWFLQAQGVKIGKQAWLGEKFTCTEPDMVTIGDYVSVCSAVSVVCSTEARSARVTLLDSCAVTNETTVLPGVVVHPEAVLGVYSLGRPGQVFPPGSITQGEVVLHPGRDIESGGKVDASGTKGVRNLKAVSGWVFARYNVLYWIATLTLLPMSLMVKDLPLAVVLISGLYFGGCWMSLALLPIGVIIALTSAILWMAFLKLIMLWHSAGSHPLYGFRASAWQLLCILGYVFEDFVPIMGSQMFVWYMRMQGAKVGKNCCVMGGFCTEWDLLTIGDNSVVGDQAFFMGHTVEHRCVKMGPVTLGKRVTVGTLSAVLPGAVLEDGCTIGDVSLVMKQELVPAGAVWCGIPAVPVEHTKLSFKLNSKLSYV